MFTGIIEVIGEIIQVTSLGSSSQGDIRARIASGDLDLSDVKIGDSIAVNGACLTVTALTKNEFTVEVSRETLDCTQGLDRQGERVNLEKALRLSDRLGGHLVSGHVDGVGDVIKFEPIGISWSLVVKPPTLLLKYITRKGSIAVNGVSLTINSTTKNRFGLNLIPHTLTTTALSHLKPGTKVNLEIDILARYMEQMMSDSRQIKG